MTFPDLAQRRRGSHQVSLLRLDTAQRWVQVPEGSRLASGERIRIEGSNIHGVLSRQPIPIRIWGPFGPGRQSGGVFETTDFLDNLGFSDKIHVETIAPFIPGEYVIEIEHPGNPLPFVGPDRHDAVLHFHVVPVDQEDPRPEPGQRKEPGAVGKVLDKATLAILAAIGLVVALAASKR